MEPNITSPQQPPQQNIPQQPQQPLRPPILKKPDMPIVPQKKSHGLLWLVVVFLIIVLGGAGYYFFFSQKPASNQVVNNVESIATSTPKVSDILPINDADLKIPVDVAVIDCGVVDSLTATSSDGLTNYVTSTSTAKASTAVQSLIKKYSVQINTYVKGGDWAKTATVPDINDKLCSLNTIRNIANIALANAKFLAETKKPTAAEKIITGVLDTTQQIQDNAGSVIGFLVTRSIRESAINLLLVLKSRGLINATSYKPVLVQYFDNGVGLKKVWQNEYSRNAQRIDDIASGKYNSPILADDDFVSIIIKNKTSYNFEPNNTKLLLYNFFKTAYTNAGLSCGSTTNAIIPKFDLSSSTENYIGKTIFSDEANSIGADTLTDIRCKLETKFSQF